MSIVEDDVALTRVGPVLNKLKPKCSKVLCKTELEKFGEATLVFRSPMRTMLEKFEPWLRSKRTLSKVSKYELGRVEGER